MNIEPVGIPAPNLNPSPKTRFRESGNNISEHRKMTETHAFQRGVDFALMEYQALLAASVSDNPQLASVAGFKMTGAHEFLMTLRLLSEQPRIATRPATANLDHHV